MKNLIIVLFSLYSTTSIAQSNPNMAAQWGFALGIETQYMGIDFLEHSFNPEISVFDDPNKPGFTAGITWQKPLWRSLGFRTGLNFSSTYNLVNFFPYGKSKYQFNDVELPVYFTLTNNGPKTAIFRGKILLGALFGYKFSGRSDERLSLVNDRYALDLGIGVDVKLGKLIVSPEAIYSHGMNNSHNYVGKEYDFWVGRVERSKLAFRILLMRAK